MDRGWKSFEVCFEENARIVVKRIGKVILVRTQTEMGNMLLGTGGRMIFFIK